MGIHSDINNVDPIERPVFRDMLAAFDELLDGGTRGIHHLAETGMDG